MGRAERNVTIRMSLEQADELDRRWKVAGFKSLQDAGIHAYTHTFWEEGAGQESDVPVRFRPLIKKLAEILASGDQSAIDAVEANINFFRDRLKPSGRKQR